MTRRDPWDTDDARHLTALERRVSAAWLKVGPDMVKGPPTGLLVGEMPGTGSNARMPLFPHPQNSAGARLVKISRIDVGVYLGRLRRVNVFERHREDWPSSVAHTNAELIHQRLREEDLQGLTRVVLLGQRTGLAFGHRRFYTQQDVEGILYTCIPHPSGLNLMYNDPMHRVAAQAAVQWAANLIGALPVQPTAPSEENVPDAD